MKVFHVLMLITSISLFACSGSEEDPGMECDSYYLASLGEGGEVYYNSDGLISEYMAGKDTSARFEYNADKLLKSRENEWLEAYYYYDNAKKIKYVMEYYDGSFRDSIVFAFNSENLITSLKYYHYYNFQMMLTKQIDYEYTNRNATKATHYKLDDNNPTNLKLYITFLYEYDNKKIPFPKETWPFYYVFDNGSIGENNVTKQILRKDGQADSESVYSYKYNSDGYPTEMKIGGTLAQEYSYTCEPNLRGN